MQNGGFPCPAWPANHVDEARQEIPGSGASDRAVALFPDEAEDAGDLILDDGADPLQVGRPVEPLRRVLQKHQFLVDQPHQERVAALTELPHPAQEGPVFLGPLRAGGQNGHHPIDVHQLLEGLQLALAALVPAQIGLQKGIIIYRPVQG
ncbi:MAG: hypothetical protein GX442_14935 [Candidatus Riflebacteria bacterium]|nr:hypothetical protein [Candidatus Riflebacteria bacterium]